MVFTPDWLALREPADHAARDAALLARARTCAAGDTTVVDLGSGTGSTARAFGVGDWTWHFIDGNPELLDVARANHPGATVSEMDLARLGDLPLADASLVTASALLDLMPVHWIGDLAQALSVTGTPFYAALTYNGIMRWDPAFEQDSDITEAFNAHQLRDKGMGPAMGADAGARSAVAFQECGFTVTCADSPWVLRPDQRDLQEQLIQGIGFAAGEMGLESAGDWVNDRLAALDNGSSVIGHTDLLALPGPSAGTGV